MPALCLPLRRRPDAGSGQSLHLASIPKTQRYASRLHKMNVIVFFAVLAFSLQMRNSLEQRRRALRTMAKRYRSWQRRLDALEAEHQWYQDHAHNLKPAAEPS